jgi:D-glycero-alpha-D-manno-heptose-7-phosphate kinase
MGSSSAFTVGTLNALYALMGQSVSRQQLALDAIHVEQNMIKENVGSQDQVAAAFGGLNKIIFGGSEKVSVRPLVLSTVRSKSFESRLMLFFSGLSRTASEIAGEWIKNTPRNGDNLRKMQSMVDEGSAILSDEHRDLDDFGRLLHENWMRKRELSDRIATSAIDEIYGEAMNAGAIGGKLLGAGGGGFILFYVPEEKRENVKERLKHLLHVPFNFDNSGSHIIYNAGTGMGKPGLR